MLYSVSISLQVEASAVPACGLGKTSYSREWCPNQDPLNVIVTGIVCNIQHVFPGSAKFSWTELHVHPLPRCYHTNTWSLLSLPYWLPPCFIPQIEMFLHSLWFLHIHNELDCLNNKEKMLFKWGLIPVFNMFLHSKLFLHLHKGFDWLMD